MAVAGSVHAGSPNGTRGRFDLVAGIRSASSNGRGSLFIWAVGETRAQLSTGSNRWGDMSPASAPVSTAAAVPTAPASLTDGPAGAEPGGPNIDAGGASRTASSSPKGLPFAQVLRAAVVRPEGVAHREHPASARGHGLPDPPGGPKRRRVGPFVDAESTTTNSLDPITRQTAHLAPPPAVGAVAQEPPSALVELQAHASLEELIPTLARRIAWSNDGRRGAVRIEVGEGRLAGATVLVTADDGRVSVDMEMPSTATSAGWQQRIAERLASRGLDVEKVDVR